MAAMTVEKTPIEALGAAEWALWDEMVAANPELVSPYFRPEFTRIAGRVCPGAAVAVFLSEGRIVGFFPHQSRGGTIQPIGAPMNDYHGVIARPGEAPDLETVARLMGAERLSVPAWVGPAGVGEPRHMMMAELPEAGYEAWYAERRASFKKYFKDKERARRSMEAELGPVQVEWGMRDPALLDRLIDLKSEQYRRSQFHDVFACGWTVDLLRELMMNPEGGVGASIAVLWAGERLAAIEYSMHAGRHYHFWFPAYEPTLARCSPGIILSMETMRHASQAGYRVFDYGFGGEVYKKYFCNAEHVVREAVVTRPGLQNSAIHAASSLIGLAGHDRAERLRTSVRRRWAAIEACETDPSARLRGVAAAAVAALTKSRGQHSAA